MCSHLCVDTLLLLTQTELKLAKAAETRCNDIGIYVI